MTAPTSATGTRILVTGGVRSGKSRHAESLLLPPARPEDTPVTYLACGPRRDDADWAERVAAHRARRPATWTTVEDPDAEFDAWSGGYPVPPMPGQELPSSEMVSTTTTRTDEGGHV